MKRTLLLAACAALLASPVLAQSNDEGRRLVEAGRAAFDMGDYAGAAQILWDATMADAAVRDDAQLQILRGRAVMRSGRPENAIRIFDLIGGSAEAYADALYWRGEALMMMTEPGEAADSYREALRFNPDHALAQARLSSLPPGISTPVAVEAPLIDSAPVDVIAVESTAPAVEAPAPEVSAPASLRPAPPEPPEMEETPAAAAEANPEQAAPETIQVAAAAPEPAPEPEPEPEPAIEPVQTAAAPVRAPAESAEGELRSSAQQQAAMAAEGRAAAEEAHAAGDRAAEAFGLSRVYLSQLATDEEIERYAELTEGAVSADPARDFEIAQLASYAGFGAHNRLSAALYRAVEAAGGLEGRNLAVLKANLGTVMLQAGDADAALAEAEAALAADETYANGWAVRSLAKQELGDLGGALEDAKQAYDRGVMSPPVLALLQAAGFAVNVPGAADETALRGVE